MLLVFCLKFWWVWNCINFVIRCLKKQVINISFTELLTFKWDWFAKLSCVERELCQPVIPSYPGRQVILAECWYRPPHNTTGVQCSRLTSTNTQHCPCDGGKNGVGGVGTADAEPAALIGCKQRAARQAAVRLRLPRIPTIKTAAAVATPIQQQTDTASLACQPVTCCTCLAHSRGLQCGETGNRRVRRENAAASRPLSHTAICHDLTNCESACEVWLTRPTLGSEEIRITKQSTRDYSERGGD